MSRAYLEAVAREDRHVREMLALNDVAERHGLADRSRPSLARMVADWEGRFPRLSTVLRDRHP